MSKMKKSILALFVLIVSLNSFSGKVGLPREILALPEVEGTHLVCIWDEIDQVWLREFETYDHAGEYDFQLPEWGKWYWVGLWDVALGDYVFEKWVGHFQTD